MSIRRQSSGLLSDWLDIKAEVLDVDIEKERDSLTIERIKNKLEFKKQLDELTSRDDFTTVKALDDSIKAILGDIT